ncbi:MAG: HD-GYP domain-containing protein [Candidatus Aminicenantales bacterium]
MSEEEKGKVKEEMETTELKDKSLSKIGEEIFLRFSSALRTASIYEANNLTFLRQINILFNLVYEVLRKEGEAVFRLRESALFFNSVRVRLDFSNFQSFKFLAEELGKKEITSFAFESGLCEEELTQFVMALKEEEVGEENPFEDFLKRMEIRGIRNVSLEKISPFERQTRLQTKKVKQYAKKVFFKSITHLKEVFEREREKKRVRLKTTRRLMQSIVNLMIQDEAFMMGLTNLKNYDEYTLNHSVNVCILAVCLGRRLGLDKKELVDLGVSAFFHDIGKLDIPKEILDKPACLTPEERRVIEKHTYLGAGRLVRLKEMSYLPVRALYVALEHHLRSDLSGYPRYWKKNSINLYSKIVEICDFFDALTTKRPYREDVFTRNDALSLMIEKSGKDFDPLLLKVFANMVGAYPIGTLVALDTGELAVVTETNPDVAFYLRPKVKLITDSSGNRIDGDIVDLTEKDAFTHGYKRTIVKSLNPHKYGINVADYFFSQEEEEQSESAEIKAAGL